MRLIYSPVILLLLLVALTAAACGGGDDDNSQATQTGSSNQAPTPTGNLCNYLSIDSLSQLFGETVTVATPGGSLCSFAGAGPDSINISQAGFGTDPTAAKQEFQSTKPANATDVSSYGDAAYWYPGNDPNALELNVLKGTRVLIVNVYSSRGSGANLSTAEQIAQTLLPYFT